MRSNSRDTYISLVICGNYTELLGLPHIEFAYYFQDADGSFELCVPLLCLTPVSASILVGTLTTQKRLLNL